MGNRLPRIGLGLLLMVAMIAGVIAAHPLISAMMAQSAVYWVGEGDLRVSNSAIFLGSAGADTVLPFVVPVRNCGCKPLTIEKLRTDCGCLAVGEDLPVKLQPGVGKKLRFRLHVTENMRGHITKKISVSTDETDAAPVNVDVSVLVVPEFKLVAIPATIDLGVVTRELPDPKTVTIVSPFPEELLVSSVSTTDHRVMVKDISPGPKPYTRQLSVELSAELEPGPHRSLVTVQTNTGKVTIPVVGIKAGLLLTQPRSIVFGPPSGRKGTSARVFLSSADGSSFRIVRADTNGSCVSVTSDLPSPSRSVHELQVTLAHGADWRSQAGKQVVLIETDSLGTALLTCHYPALLETAAVDSAPPSRLRDTLDTIGVRLQ